MSERSVQKIEQAIRGVIAGSAMLPRGCTVIVGFSGGADSLALTHFLFRHAKEFGVRLLAAHVNHGLRGEESDRDEAFVRRWCGENGIELRVKRTDVAALAARDGLGLEECARKVRYEFFDRLAGEWESARISTAHTLSDQAETVLLHLARGSGLHGLCGIAPVRGSLIRPLLQVTRAQTEEYCAYYQLPYVTDSSNFDRFCARNRLRLDAVPALLSVNPAFEQAVGRMVRQLSQDEEYLQGQAFKALQAAQCPGGWRLAMLRELPQPVLTRALALALQKASHAQQESVHLTAAALCVRGGGGVTVGGGVRVRAQGGLLTLGEEPAPAPRWSVPLTLPQTRLPDGRVLKIREIAGETARKNQKINNLLFHNGFNYDTIENNICVRNRREGDVFRPDGRGVSKSLKKLFNEAKVPPEKRGRLLILEAGGEILWVEGFGASQRASPRCCKKIGMIIVKESFDQ